MVAILFIVVGGGALAAGTNQASYTRQTADARAVRKDDEVFLISSAGVGTRMAVSKISKQKRDSTGVKVINVGDGNRLSAAAKISEEIIEEL